MKKKEGKKKEKDKEKEKEANVCERRLVHQNAAVGITDECVQDGHVRI